MTEKESISSYDSKAIITKNTSLLFTIPVSLLRF